MKPTLIILPGWGGTKETWQDFIKIAQKDFEVICLNLPCFGDEPCPEEVWGVEDYAEFVKDKILNLKQMGSVEKLYLLGHSFGGQVASRLVIDNPGLVDKLILSGAAVFRPRRGLRRTIFALIAKFGKFIFRLPIIEKFDVLAKKFLYRLANSPDYVNTSGIKRDIFKKVIREDLTENLSKIIIPTLIVWGTKDSYVPLENGKKINKLIPNSKLEIIKNGKHGLHIQMPEILFQKISNFK